MYLVLSMAVASGCGGGTGSGTQSMIDAFGTSIADLRAMSRAHGVAVQAARDLPGMAALERDHRTEMGAPMNRLVAAADGLEGCGRLCCMDGAAMMRGMGRELDDHAARMAAATDVGAAQAEESRHQAEIQRDFDDLDAQHARLMDMMGMGMELGCPGQ